MFQKSTRFNFYILLTIMCGIKHRTNERLCWHTLALLEKLWITFLIFDFNFANQTLNFFLYIRKYGWLIDIDGRFHKTRQEEVAILVVIA